jgi:hypothetical protein
MRHPASILIVLLALGLAGLAGNGPAWSAPQTLSVSAKKARPHPSRRETGQIACTIIGCIRIPPECHPEMGYNLDGIPTGFDIVVCPEPRRR